MSKKSGTASLGDRVVLRRVSTVDALTDALRVRILDGTLGPGEPLREVELAAEFTVGRHSLRAALQALVFEGLLRHEPNKGVFVPKFTAEDVADLFTLRIALETEAANVLVRQRRSVEAVRLVQNELDRLREGERWDRVTEIDLRFHRTLVGLVGSTRLSRVFMSLQSELSLLLAQLQSQYASVREISEEHELVISAIESGKASRAVNAVRSHLEEGIQVILGALESGSDEPSERHPDGSRARTFSRP